ncbi:hypothetical protein DM02DRAFT_618839 [Periconia macrospinosa]|uniref:Uncharacterized protein n=1 Tax=Periconia macrospinosa TaxID=97972 RepID=A0A2V1DAB9_9PLEO|nr:hypothetical protein DM02DRAFT_618839 [Periconia macrospinosa]
MRVAQAHPRRLPRIRATQAELQDCPGREPHEPRRVPGIGSTQAGYRGLPNQSDTSSLGSLPNDHRSFLAKRKKERLDKRKQRPKLSWCEVSGAMEEADWQNSDGESDGGTWRL